MIGPRHIQSKSRNGKNVREVTRLETERNSDTLKLDPSALVASRFPSELVVVTTIGIELSSMTVTFGDTAFVTQKREIMEFQPNSYRNR